MALTCGVDIKTLSEMLGHNSAELTLNTYLHVTDSLLGRAAEIMGGVIHAYMRKERET